MKTSTLPRLLALVALTAAPILAFPACNGGDVPIGSDNQKVSCNTDSDCPMSQGCIGGFCCAPQAEICNGLDDDCDGVVDNAASCNNGLVCVNGQCVQPAGCMTDSDCPQGQACINGACGPIVCVPQAETCNGLDDDCDGVVDNGPDAVLCNGSLFCINGVCVPSPPCNSDAECGPNHVCDNGVCKPSGCQPVAEICNGLDDDCDGVVDNGALCGGGVACVNGQCGGAQPCNTDADCSPAQVCLNGFCGPSGCQPQPEVCDGIDNDCDGVIDDGASCPGGGMCVNGQCLAPSCQVDSDCPPNQACVNSVCVPVGCVPKVETCNGIDDDCDGTVDNGAICGGGIACVNGSCPCASNADCDPAQTCVNGVCKP